MKDNRKCDTPKTIRLPSFLVNRIESINNVPKCKTSSDKYRYFLETGVQSFEEFQKVLNDPTYIKRATQELENIFMDGMIIENLMNMDESKLKGLSMAADLVRSKRRI
jgi:hypothetical protein